MLGPVDTVDEIDSTNAELLRRARAGSDAGLVLVARHQTAGRGRRDRRWEAPRGASLLVSVLLRPDLPADRLHLLTFAAGLAAVDACRAVAGVELVLKWPNDVITPGAAKVAGLLAESTVSGGRVDAVVVGMGLNVDWDGAAVPAGGADLAGLAGARVGVDDVLAAWLAAYDELLGRLDDVPRRYRAACATLGQEVQVSTDAGTVRGRAVDVDDRGHLVVECPEPRTFAVADVVHVRV